MPRTGENIYRRKDGRWEGRFSKGKVGDKRVSGYVYGRTYGEAKAKLAIARSKFYADLGGDKPPDDELQSQYEEFEEFLEWKAFRKEFREFMAMRELRGKNAKAPVSSASEPSESNSAQGDISSRIESPYKSAPRRRRTRPLSEGEIEAIEKYMLDAPNPLKLGVLLCMHAGIRLGELSALRWGDISQEDGVIHIRHTVQRVHGSGGSTRRTTLSLVKPKFKSAVRSLTIPHKLCTIIDSLRERDSFFVLTGEDEFMDPRTIQNHFHRMMGEIGVEGVTIEDCRKSHGEKG